MENKSISVIIPCYNVEKYLDRCLNTIVNQTLQNIEIILVDDGSQDKVPELCDRWAKEDTRIKVLHKQNEGLGYARNSGMELATGEYIAFVDSDDYIDLNMYATLYNEAKESGADAVFCGFQTEVQKNVWLKSNEVKQKKTWEGKEIIHLMLDMVANAPKIKKERNFQMSVWHSIYKHDIIKTSRIKFHSEREIVSEDIPFQIQFLKKANKVVYLPHTYYNYCLNESSITMTYKRSRFQGYINLRKLLKELLADIDGSNNRINRLFIGYVRSNVCKLLSQKIDDTETILHQIISNTVWKELKSEFPASYLPLYSKVLYILILKGNIKQIKTYVGLINCTKVTVQRLNAVIKQKLGQ